MSHIEELETLADGGLLDSGEAGDAIRNFGVAYQLVTDETSMLVLSDEAFERYGIERRNRERTSVEQQAQVLRRAAPARSYRVDSQDPMFRGPSPSIGGGAIDPLSGAIVLGLGALAVAARRRRDADRVRQRGRRGQPRGRCPTRNGGAKREPTRQ